MTDRQITTLIDIGIFLPFLAIIGAMLALLYWNKRIADLKTELIGHMELLLRLHEAEHHNK